MSSRSRKQFMELAISESEKCESWPKVGAVIAKGGVVLSSGYRGEINGWHAERCAISKVSKEDLEQAVLYTTLEPCVALGDRQEVESCADLIISTGIREVVVGALDENGTVYGKGCKALIEAGKKISSFSNRLQEKLRECSYEHGDTNIGQGASGRRTVSVIGSADKPFEVHFPAQSGDRISFKWSSLQPNHGCVDLHAGRDEVREAVGVKRFEDVHDPLLYHKKSHVARMRANDIAIVYPEGSGFILLVQLIEIYENDISFQWQARKP